MRWGNVLQRTQTAWSMAAVLQCGLFYMRGRHFDGEKRNMLKQRVARLNILTIDSFGAENLPNVAVIPYATRFHYTPAFTLTWPLPLTPSTALLDNSADLRWSRKEGREEDRPRSHLRSAQDLPMMVPAGAGFWNPEELALHTRPIFLSYVGMNSRGKTFRSKSWLIKRQVRHPS
jgi:hypothetical protein